MNPAVTQPRSTNAALQRLLREVRACTICAAHLPQPPRPECAATWRARLLEQLPSIELTLVIGTYAQAWHLKQAGTGANLTATVGAWRQHGAQVLPLPHPSPRNNGWLQRNPWFEADVLPELKARVRALQGR